MKTESLFKVKGGNESGCLYSLTRTHLLARPIDVHVSFSKGLIDRFSCVVVIMHFISKCLCEHTSTLYRKATVKSYMQEKASQKNEMQ